VEINFEPLQLKHKDIYNAFPIYGPNSKFSFAQGFMWQESYKTRICVRDDYLLFTACPKDETFFVAPILRDQESIVPAINEMIELSNGDLCIHYACPEIITAINKYFPDKFEFELNRDDSEYVYIVQDLINLAGKKYHQKKNHVNTFCRNHSYEFAAYTDEYLDACLSLQQKWLETSDNGDIAESEAIKKALLHYNELNIQAGVILQDGNVTAFSIGERIGNDVVILIEKASPEYNGLFQVINRDTLSHLFPDCKYVNRCEDLGIEGLRKAKLSYRPCFLIDKYTCRLK